MECLKSQGILWKNMSVKRFLAYIFSPIDSLLSHHDITETWFDHCLELFTKLVSKQHQIYFVWIMLLMERS